MLKQLHVSSTQELTTLSKNVILKEHDERQAIRVIAHLLQRLSKLYQLPNWSEENAVILAEWIFDNYKYEDAQIVIECLKNPPETDGPNWRLTPDTIKKWMIVHLENKAEIREKENAVLKEEHKDPLPSIDYEAYKKRIDEQLKDKDKPWTKENEYQEFRANYYKSQLRK